MNKKYNPPQKKKTGAKISFEKKTAIQAFVSVVLAVYCVVVANVNYFPNHKIFLHKAVNITWNRQDIKNFMNRSKKAFEYIGTAGEKYFDIMTSVFEGDLYNTFGTSAYANMSEPHIYPIPQSDAAPHNEEQITDSGTEAFEKPVFRYPAEGRITSAFGSRSHPINGESSIHYGTDIAANEGDCVIASLPGVVSDTGYDISLGNYVKVRHDESMETVYGHLSEILVKKDEVVDSNTRIGSAGSTGAATGPHVHLEVRIDGVCKDPMLYLPPKTAADISQ